MPIIEAIGKNSLITNRKIDKNEDSESNLDLINSTVKEVIRKEEEMVEE